MILIRIAPPEGVSEILEVLNRHGYKAYAVGGCIRDAVMGREPKDWDIATDARPEEVGRLFERTADTGIKHGTVSVILDGGCYEVTTFRADGRYTDSRHPEKVEFTSGIGDDLRRRDFTINAMAWRPGSGIIDPFGGMEDISRRLIRTVGRPSDRFGEDALRMLRAVRFASVLGFEIEKGTLEGIRQNCSLICRISADRIREELTALLVSDHPGKFMLLKDTGLLRFIIPELDACFNYHGENAEHSEYTEHAKHIIRSVAAVDADICLRWTMLLHDTGKCTEAGETDNATAAVGNEKLTGHGNLAEPVNVAGSGEATDSLETADIILRRLKFDNKSRNRILKLIRYLGMEIKPERRAMARVVLEAGRDVFADLLKVKRAHIAAFKQDGDDGEVACKSYWPGRAKVNDEEQHQEADGRCTADELRQLEKTEAIFKSLLEEGYCLSLKELEINGNDLKRLGFSEGTEIGRVLNYLLDKVIDEPGLNNNEMLEKLAMEYLDDRANGKQGI
jgi:tRNA nucleotidyltransferase (CCA-adding enzyme)